MTQPGAETGIPILTEVIQAPVYGVDTPERRARPRPPAVATDQPDAGDTAAFDRIAASVRAQVLQQLHDRVDATLEQRIRDSLAETVQVAVAQLTAQVRQGLQETVDKLLTEAIATELANRHISKI